MALAPQVEDLAKAIESLPSLLDAVGALPISGWVVLIAFFLWLLANKNLSRIIEFVQGQERRRIEKLDAYIASPNPSDPSVASAVRDLRDAYYFKVATGIYAENRVRTALIKLHDATSHVITWRHICRAHPFLTVAPDGTVTVRPMDFSEKLGYWYNQAVAYFFLLFAASLFSLVILSGTKTWVSFVLGVGGGIVAAAFAMFVFSQNWPARSAKKISKEIEGQRNGAADS